MAPRPILACVRGLILLVLLFWPYATPQAATLRIDGSSTVYPLSERIADEYSRLAQGRVKVLLGISGTVGGFRLFCRGEIDIAEASRPIDAAEMAACRTAGVRYVELPVAYDAITVVIHPRNSWARTVTVEELARLWAPEAEGVLTRWSDIRPNWPNERIHLFMPGANSGTYEYFTQAIVGRKASRRDVIASEDDNVLVRGVARNPYALAYFGYAYYLDNADKLVSVAIRNDGEAWLPTPETVLSGRYRPLSRPLFIYVRDTYRQRPELRRFVEFYLDRASRVAAEMGYFPLPGRIFELARERLQAARLGSVFGGRTWTAFGIDEIMTHVPFE